MKNIAIMAACVAGCLFVTNGYAQQTSQPGPGRTAATGHKDRTAEKGAKRTEPGHAFSGRVVQVDGPAGAFSAKGNGIIVRFDASNPTFSGYRSLSDIHPGDRVAVSYTVDGIRVTKLSGQPMPVEREEARIERQPAAGVPEDKRPRVVGRLIKREKKRGEISFSDADIDNDGRISPVELSAVIKDVTMDEFRRFDKNHKGYLDKAEFLEAVKHLKARGR